MRKLMTRFSEHLQWYLEFVVSRKRNPVKPSTVLTWRVCADKWLIPSLGHLPCEEVNNKAVRSLVEKMAGAALSPQTISNYLAVVKLSLGAATDENGEPLYPRKWNHAFLDLPLIKTHKQPTFSPEIVSSIVSNANGQTKVLLALLAATGLRMGEALGLGVKHVSPDARTLTVEQSCWNGSMQTPKTSNAYRKVDLCTPIAVMLGEHLGDRSTGLVFQTTTGTPFLQSNLLRRKLHPLLKDLNIEKCGFHAFRRFRATHLRISCSPESLLRYWLGHCGVSITDVYDKSALNDGFRQAEAERVGTGFEL
jgi:integrase